MQKTLTALVLGLSLVSAANAQSMDLSNGEANYKMLCTSCHGDKGHGDGIAGKSLPEQPSNIYEGLTSFWESESELIDTVLNGNEGMPAWKSILNEEDVKDIFAYINTINK